MPTLLIEEETFMRQAVSIDLNDGSATDGLNT
jgi:hypothetical protein